MAGKTLEEYFVSLGIKGQNVVLSNIDKVKKKAKDLSGLKSSVNLNKIVNFGKSKLFGGGGIMGNNIIPPQQQPSKEKKSSSQQQPSPEQKNENKTEKENNKKFSDSVKKFAGEGVKRFAGAAKDMAIAASSLDPVALMQGMTNAMAKVAGGWQILGFSAGKAVEGLADLMNAGVGMAAGAVNSAKQSAAATYGLSQRNVTTAYYGGQGIKQTSGHNPIMSREEHAQLVMEVAGAYGQIQKPLQNVLNKLVETKDTAALGRVAAGNWASTGTDKGWMLQQITNQTAGLPPSIAQAIQASLLKNNKNLIQNKTEGGITEEGQRANARWKNADEDLQKKLFNASQGQLTNLIELNKSFNNITVNLVKSGASLVACVNTVASAVNSAISKIHGEAHK